MKKSLKIPAVLYRSGGSKVGEKGEIELSISSDVPYKRYDWYSDEEYWEVLDHSPSAVDTTRLQAGAALLFNHDRDIQLGTICAPEFRDGKCYVQAKLSAADDTRSYRTRIEEGILKDTSVGYRITDDGVCIGAKEELPIYKFKWAPHEASMVTIPADITVGVGRSREDEAKSEMREISVEIEDSLDKTLKKKQTTPANMNITTLNKRYFFAKDDGGSGGEKEQEAIDLHKARQEAVKEFQARCAKIKAHVDAIKNAKWKEAAQAVANKHIAGEADFEEFRTEANNAIDAITSKAAAGESDHSGIEVVGDRPQRALSVGAEFMRSKEVTACGGKLQRGQTVGVTFPISMIGIRGKVALAQRAGFTSSDLSAVNQTVSPGIISLGVQRLTIMDVLASGTIGTGSYKYARENGFGTIDGVAVAAGKMPRAKTVGERGLKPIWEPDLTTETANVSKVAITTKVPDEFLADFPSAMAYIDERMPFMVDTETEFQILYGDGLNNNLKGIFTMTGTQTRAILTTSDTTIAASLRKGLTDIQVGAQFEPDFYGFHPYDWETASLLVDTAGRFLAGGPFYIPYTSGVFMELRTFWGKPVVVSTAITEGNPICGCGKLGAQVLIREGMRIETTNANEDDFRRNLICLRAEHRLALPVYRPVSFLEFTGFPARA